ncbi:MAG: hypothetical protein ACD_76C00014G0003 [uncultured bacterium]|nr:MAG: hypothetical protein ACD_76C00014G0003 [uncultured bacterium]HBD05485.1 tRNA (adenosine(37)-N6)-threonylcarbamoyltransferase complex transferase subunit TsaD [Candidatus Uhrbacteria bacterium]
MRIFAIETSCDETAVAVVDEARGKFRVIKNLVSSQVKLHAKYGGVVPELAAREHAKNLPILLKQARVPRNGHGIDVVAVTAGPGLVVALRNGVETAKCLAHFWNKPLVGVNHMEGHIYSNWLMRDPREIIFPALNLVVSGGHTMLVLMKGHGKYVLLGETRDDAVGEAFDKSARLMDLPYPGGPSVSARAQMHEGPFIKLPRPMILSPDFDFSFSGLKTAVLYSLLQTPKRVKKTDAFINQMCASFEEAVVDVLYNKTMRAVKKYNPKTILVCGGVSANARLRERFMSMDFDAPVFFPEKRFTGDNAAMIAVAGAFMAKKKLFSDPFKIKADPNKRFL